MKRKGRSLGPRIDRSARGNWRLRLTYAVLIVVGISVCVGTGWLAARSAGRPSGRAPSSLRVRPELVPPWGQLEYTALELERPDDMVVTQRLELPLPPWWFGNMTEAQLEALFTAPDLTPAQRQALTDRTRWSAAADGWLVQPPAEVVRSLSPAARARIYGVLFQHPRNRSRGRPFRIAADKFEGWLASCGLPPQLQGLFRSLTYRQGESVCFADFELIEAHCTLEQQRQLSKAFSRCPALLMRLRLGSESDLESLVEYWSRYRPPRVVKPFLESLMRVPGGAALNVAFFFPPFARLRLYTYPDPAAEPDAAQQDCFWTALNFANDRPDARFHNEALVQSTLRSAYAEVPPPRQFGDLILLLEEGRTAIHLCVYVADDVVFTKNGADLLRPWVLMKLSDVIQEYRSFKGKPVQAIGLRRIATASS